jgi:hypothetical protein
MAEQLDVVTKTYDLALWLLPQVAKFPRAHRFTLGERMESAVLDVLEQLVEAQYTARKLELLRQVNRRLERLRFLVRLAKDLQVLGQRRYEHACERLHDVGSLVGGWIRQQQRKDCPAVRVRIRGLIRSTA